MENKTAIEKSIQEFVFSKIQTQVCLDVKSKTISVKNKLKHRSVELAKFWLRVLRHQNNYPKHPYKNKSNTVILKVDSVTMTTYMSNGTLMIQGKFVFEWFVKTFQTILDSYDAPINKSQMDKLNDEHIVETVGEYAEEGDVSEIASRETDTGLADTLKQAEDSVAEELADNLASMSLGIWSGETLEAQLDNLRTCCVHDGSTFVYKLWKSLLDHWFRDPARKVFIVTPFLDVSRLADICKIILIHRLQANLDSLYVREQCDHRKRKIFEVKKNVLEKFDSKDHMFLEHKIYSSIIYPVKTFHAKFIGCIKGNEAEVLITSANFHANHFEHSNMETVQYQTMSDVEFVSRFLRPIHASVQVQK